MTITKKTVKVWDPLVRIGHWTLVIAFFTAYITEDDLLTQHVWAGYVVGVVVSIRVLWGLVGSRHARFNDFIYSPAKIFGYLKGLIANKPQHYTGHNPAGGVMVLALLLSLTGTTLTGLELYAVEDGKGPLAHNDTTRQFYSALSSNSLISKAQAEDNDDDEKYEGSEGRSKNHTVDKETEEYWEELHELFANFTLVLVFLHVAGVIVSSIVDKENLVKAMFTGKKEIDDSFQ